MELADIKSRDDLRCYWQQVVNRPVWNAAEVEAERQALLPVAKTLALTDWERYLKAREGYSIDDAASVTRLSDFVGWAREHRESVEDWLFASQATTGERRGQEADRRTGGEPAAGKGGGGITSPKEECIRIANNMTAHHGVHFVAMPANPQVSGQAWDIACPGMACRHSPVLYPASNPPGARVSNR